MSFLKRHTILSLLLLAVLLAPAVFCAVLLMEEEQNRELMKDRLEESTLTTVTVPVKDVKWVKDGREVILYGEFFDVKKHTVSGEYITLTGLYDADEKEIKKELALLLQEENEESSPLGQLALKFFFNTAVDRNNINAFQVTINCSFLKSHYGFYTESAKPRHIAVSTPPPNV